MSLYKKKNGKHWYYKFYYKDFEGKTKQKCVNTHVSKYGSKKEAEKEGKRLKEIFLQGLRNNPNDKVCHHEAVHHNNDTIAEYAQYWLACMKGSIRDNTWVSYKQVFDKHIVPRLGHIRICDLNQFDVAQFIELELRICEEMQQKIDERIKKNPGKEIKIKTEDRPFTHSIKKHVSHLHMMLEFAVAEGDIPENVVKKVNKQVKKKIPASEFNATPYNKEEISKLREVIKGSIIEAPIMLASCLGVRRSEAAGMKWSDVDFGQNLIYIQNTCVLVGAEIVYRDNTTKNDASKSVLPLMPNLRNYLLQLKEQQEKEKKIFGDTYQDCEYICRWPNGAPIKPGYITSEFSALLKRNNLRHTRFHDLRHTVGTVILEETGDIKLASEVLRHSDIYTTAQIYAQPGLGYKAKGLAIFNDEDEPDDNEK